MKSGTIEIVVALFVLFVALLDPQVSLVIAIAALIALGIYHWKGEKRVK
jgi:hypothetical protein